MANPGDGEALRISARRCVARIGPAENGRIRIRSSRTPPALDDGPFEKIQKTVHLGRWPGVSEPPFRTVVAGNRHLFGKSQLDTGAARFSSRCSRDFMPTRAATTGKDCVNAMARR